MKYKEGIIFKREYVLGNELNLTGYSILKIKRIVKRHKDTVDFEVDFLFDNGYGVTGCVWGYKNNKVSRIFRDTPIEKLSEKERQKLRDEIILERL